MHWRSSWKEEAPALFINEQPIFKGLFIDVAVNAAVPYRNRKTTFRLISMTFHRQPSVPGPKSGEGERERKRELWCIRHNWLLMKSLTPSTFVGPLWEPQPRSVSTRLNLTHSAIHFFPQGHNVSHPPPHSQLQVPPKLPIQAKVHSRGMQDPDKCLKQSSVCKQVLSINAPGGDEILVGVKPWYGILSIYCLLAVASSLAWGLRTSSCYYLRKGKPCLLYYERYNISAIVALGIYFLWLPVCRHYYSLWWSPFPNSNSQKALTGNEWSPVLLSFLSYWQTQTQCLLFTPPVANSHLKC